jgi:hypothetical protein
LLSASEYQGIAPQHAPSIARDVAPIRPLRQSSSMAKQTRDPKLAASVLAKAADLNEKVDDLSLSGIDGSLHAPDVDCERRDVE